MEGLKVNVGGRKVFGDIETEACVGRRCLAALFTLAYVFLLFAKDIEEEKKHSFILEISNQLKGFRR